MDKGKNKQLLSKQVTNWFRGIAAIMIVLSHYAEWWIWFTPTEGYAEILRVSLNKMGIYGVDIFFLLSGYAMVKSFGRERKCRTFIKRRVENVYIPYLIVVGSIELLEGGFESLQAFLSFGCGYDYWYMFVLFMFYIGFVIIWAIIGSREVRVIIFALFTFVFSYILYNKGMQEFWYVSNITFALGAIVGEYEEHVKQMVNKVGRFAIFILSAGMIYVIYTGVFGNVSASIESEAGRIWEEIGATLVWTVLVLIVAAKWKFCDKAIIALGKSSLYVYLTHTYIFMKCINYFEYSFALRFLISAVITVAFSVLCNLIITGLHKLPFGKRRGADA